MENTKRMGRVTIPTQVGFDQETIELIARWGADAIRDCDGTKLPDSIKKEVEKVYTTYFLTRGDQEWAYSNQEDLQQFYLMSEYTLAEGNTLEIDLLKGFFEQQIRIDELHDAKEWWEVIDRTTEERVAKESWSYNNGKVTIENAIPWHEYTVSFLSYAIWDPTQMYNHITNDWGDKLHEMPYDARKPKTRDHMLKILKEWLNENEDCTVVRFTTFFYHFTLVFNDLAKEKFVDWFGYSASISPDALEAFQQERGYKLTPEDIVNKGYYNSPFCVPSKAYLDLLDFQQQFVCELAAKCVEMAHERGKEAMMFLGDNWIGTEPYGKHFEKIKLDAVVGSVGSGATLRMISDIPHVKYTEGRFLPYFFPDTFHEGGDPVKEARENWLCARRAIMRKPVDRIGYGGYLSLAAQFPDFVEYVEHVCNEFREIYENINGTKPYVAPFKVAVLNSWGKLRSWQTHMVAHALWYKQIYSYIGIIEALSGMAVDVEFISFDQIKEEGIPEGVGVIINAGDAGTAWSGGENWNDEKVITTIREWVYNGGGFIGVGEPSAYLKGGHFFQLADLLGVDKEVGFTLSTRKYNQTPIKDHFLLEDVTEPLDFGEGMKNIYAKPNATVLNIEKEDVGLAVNQYGKGRGIYISGLPYSAQNTRLLLRACYFAASKEALFNSWSTTNPYTECTYYPETKKMAVINNTYEEQITTVYFEGGNKQEITLEPMGIKWFNI
ncbi:1,3-beta-galactosyl-N-acetylhexosamine phosphorylase [Niameybacter massiliensis]|uniref:1,3-beta-galactosyl-N-acetylhexosamine phosphorylase n=1 Tax=Holtiella tumoricola TaxID=3018743 RepID=A0AA42DLD7_9FIRM|nr:1,3-beta-galactosyl-N-acetylhexosamine phosphorylase [Holtiella tumoricola]MDA3731035.1 1,3-beta-galactosyl-N-acetylhexosamine phosphorylase [Holtiella tumoricola]